MWITKQEYRGLIERATANETRVELMTLHMTQLAREIAELKFAKTGLPQSLPIFQFQREATPKTPADRDTGISFDDMGDEDAHVAGFTETV